VRPIPGQATVGGEESQPCAHAQVDGEQTGQGARYQVAVESATSGGRATSVG
jgi:hypothetical protein